MRITSLETYGLRCMLAIARTGPGGQLSISEIAASEGLSAPYASKLLSVLRKAGLVTAVRGRKGGFGISRAPEEITLLDVLTALGGPLIDPDHCTKFTGQMDECVHFESCSVHGVLDSLAGMIASTLGQTTLASLIKQDSSGCANETTISVESLTDGIEQAEPVETDEC